MRLRVTDTRGHVVPGAAAFLERRGAAPYNLVTDPEGLVVQSLGCGRYDLLVGLDGFLPEEFHGIEVCSGCSVESELVLSPDPTSRRPPTTRESGRAPESGVPLPERFAQIPTEARTKATVVVAGTFTRGRGPCEFLPDGSRRWRLLRGFVPTTVYRGTVRTEYIGVAEPVATSAAGQAVDLVEGGEYLLLLTPSGDSTNRLEDPAGRCEGRDALRAEEVLAILAPEHRAGEVPRRTSLLRP
jgi:hypothetical protein